MLVFIRLVITQTKIKHNYNRGYKMSFKAGYFSNNSVKLEGKTSTLIRINREYIADMVLPEDLKGVYVLWGEGSYYVGQGFLKTRLMAHFNNKDKNFNRVYLLIFTGTYELYDEFTHYLLDLEGAVNTYLSELGLSSMNKVATLTTNLLPKHQELFNEWVEGLHLLDPTFLQQTTYGTSIEEDKHYQSISYTQHQPPSTYEEQEPVFIDSQYTQEEGDLRLLAQIPVGKGKAKGISQLPLTGDELDELYHKKGIIKRTLDGKYYQHPLVQVTYKNQAVIVSNPLNHLTQRQVLDIQIALHRGSIENGEVIKQPGVPKSIYNLLIEIGAITELRGKKVHYYLSDALADQKEEYFEFWVEEGTAEVEEARTTTLSAITGTRV